ncbi:unnamed protein product [Cuscuta europaea]|uniref:Uncharacterized protein n=1 Tax=Cuscuta europaea TaxID=41803 RepID=A0A9P0ZCV2_CUSEU|nr:unnamed protein product [Cuscuta europaea]
MEELLKLADLGGGEGQLCGDAAGQKRPFGHPVTNVWHRHHRPTLQQLLPKELPRLHRPPAAAAGLSLRERVRDLGARVHIIRKRHNISLPVDVLESVVRAVAGKCGFQGAIAGEFVGSFVEGFPVIKEGSLARAGILAVRLERIVSHIGLIPVGTESVNGGVTAGAVHRKVVLGDIAVESVAGKGVISGVGSLAVGFERGPDHIGVVPIATESIHFSIAVLSVACKPLVAGVGILRIFSKSLPPPVAVVGVGGESNADRIDVLRVGRKLPIPACGSGAVGIEFLVNYVAARGICRKPFTVPGGVAAVPAERIGRDIIVLRVFLERVKPSRPTRPVIGEILFSVDGEIGVLGVLLETRIQIGEAEQIGGGAKPGKLSGEGLGVRRRQL